MGLHLACCSCPAPAVMKAGAAFHYVQPGDSRAEIDSIELQPSEQLDEAHILVQVAARSGANVPKLLFAN